MPTFIPRYLFQNQQSLKSVDVLLVPLDHAPRSPQSIKYLPRELCTVDLAFGTFRWGDNGMVHSM